MTLEQAYKVVLEDLNRREISLRNDYRADFGRLALFKDEQYRVSGLAKLNAADDLREAVYTITYDAQQRGFNI